MDRRAFLKGGAATLATALAIPGKLIEPATYKTPATKARSERIYLMLFDTKGKQIGTRQRVWCNPAKGGKITNVNEITFDVDHAGKLGRAFLVDKHGRRIPEFKGMDLKFTAKFVMMGDIVTFETGKLVVTP